MLETIETPNKFAYGLDELSAMTSLSKAFLRKEIRAKKLSAKLFGTRVLIMTDDWEKYAESKQNWEPKKGENNDQK